MDSLTHIAIGACIGELFLEKKIGKKAMLYGAIAASLPDIDFIASFWLSTTDDLLAHRGFTHSFLFAFLVVTGLALYFRKRHSAENVTIKTWLIFMAVEIFIHLFLDAFNAYGIGWFEPISHRRISFNVIFVADPFFSVWPGIAAACLLILKRSSGQRKSWARFGLFFCSLYLIYCTLNKLKMDKATRQGLAQQGIQYNRYFSTPTPFNNWLWYIVAETDSGYQIGYRSVFDKNNHITFRYFPQNDSLLKPYREQKDLQKLIRFSQGFFTADISEHGVVFNDLRFGQMMGWQDPDAGFVFHYYLQEPESNHLVVQRGRFTNWNMKTVGNLLRRIKGYER
jgi:inner membrane protein